LCPQRIVLIGVVPYADETIRGLRAEARRPRDPF
jgi:hypothetical protein